MCEDRGRRTQKEAMQTGEHANLHREAQAELGLLLKFITIWFPVFKRKLRFRSFAVLLSQRPHVHASALTPAGGTQQHRQLLQTLNLTHTHTPTHTHPSPDLHWEPRQGQEGGQLAAGLGAGVQAVLSRQLQR